MRVQRPRFTAFPAVSAALSGAETVKVPAAAWGQLRPNDSVPGANGGPPTAAINIAVLNADFDLASLLLDAGANPNVRDARGYPIHVVVWLHKPGAPPDFAMSGVDPQPVALPSGRLSHVDMLKKLLEKGADPNATVVSQESRFTPGGGLSRNPPDLAIGRHYLTYMGATPFYLAARNGDAEMMRILAAGGANPTTPTKYGVTPLMGAACLDYYEGETAGPFSGVSEAERLEAVKLALELGNDINARTHFGDYPMTGSPEETLLRYPDNIKDLLNLEVGDMRFDQMTALHGAVICNQPSIVEYLIQKGAEGRRREQSWGWTPLMVANGIYIANNRKDFSGCGKILRRAMNNNRLRRNKSRQHRRRHLLRGPYSIPGRGPVSVTVVDTRGRPPCWRRASRGTVR